MMRKAHNPKVVSSSLTPATKTVDTVRLQKTKPYSIFKFTPFLPHWFLIFSFEGLFFDKIKLFNKLAVSALSSGNTNT